MPYVMLNEVNKLSMLWALESERYLSMSFRSWKLYEYPLLQSMTFMSRQNCNSARETAIRYLCSANWPKVYHASRYQRIR